MEKINDKYYLGSNKNTFILYEKKISSSGRSFEISCAIGIRWSTKKSASVCPFIAFGGM